MYDMNVNDVLLNIYEYVDGKQPWIGTFSALTTYLAAMTTYDPNYSLVI